MFVQAVLQFGKYLVCGFIGVYCRMQRMRILSPRSCDYYPASLRCGIVPEGSFVRVLIVNAHSHTPQSHGRSSLGTPVPAETVISGLAADSTFLSSTPGSRKR
jgi:hypothetical protein